MNRLVSFNAERQPYDGHNYPEWNQHRRQQPAKYFHFIILICLFFNVNSFSAGVWYVDKAATGLNNGTSPANAWTNLSYTDRASGLVSPGDSIYIAARTYTNLNWRPQEGTIGNWTHYYFTNGPTTLYETMVLHSYTELNGAANPNYATNIGNNTYSVALITNNCNLHIDGSTNFYGGNGGQCIWAFSDPVKLSWVHLTGTVDIPGPTPPRSDSASVIFIDPQGVTTNQSEVSYVWIDQSSGHGSAAAVAFASDGIGFNVFHVHHCLFENNGSDVCNPGAGMEYDHNIIRNRQGIGGQQCNDTFTFGGSANYTRIHHNLIEPADNTLYYLWGGDIVIHDFYFYDNIITPVRPAYQAQTIQGSGIQEQSGTVFSTNMIHIFTNVWFAHNTCIGTTNDGPGALISFISKNGPQSAQSFTIDTGAYVVKNNLFIDIDTNSQTPKAFLGFYPNSNPGGGTNDLGYGFIYTTNSIVLDYNQWWSYYPSNIFCAGWGPLGSNLTLLNNSSDIARVLGYTNNVTESPVTFVNAQGFDYRILTAPAKGQNLSTFTNVMPGIDTDIYGNTRTSWSAGAQEYQSNGLVLWLTFAQDDGWTTNHVITDRSGYGNHAYYMPSTNRNTWPAWTNGPNGLDAALFSVNYTNGFHYGTYAAITSLGTNAANSGLATFTNGTWACWAWVDYDYALGYSGDEQFLTTGQGLDNWFFGNYYSTANTSGPQFSRVSTSGGQEPMETYARFPNITTNGWNHYAVTWDGTNMVPYLNGVPFTTSSAWTNSNSFVFTNRFTGTLASTNDAVPAWSYIAVGVNNHSGTAAADDADGLPNNGQLQGRLADIRIYNRALSASEVEAIGSGGSPPPGPPPSGGGRLKTSNIHAHSMRGK